jgi:hypothetical protein
MNIIKLSITRPTVVVVTFTLFVLFGLLSYSNLSQELFPKINSSAMAHCMGKCRVGVSVFLYSGRFTVHTSSRLGDD